MTGWRRAPTRSDAAELAHTTNDTPACALRTLRRIYLSKKQNRVEKLQKVSQTEQLIWSAPKITKIIKINKNQTQIRKNAQKPLKFTEKALNVHYCPCRVLQFSALCARALGGTWRRKSATAPRRCTPSAPPRSAAAPSAVKPAVHALGLALRTPRHILE